MGAADGQAATVSPLSHSSHDAARWHASKVVLTAIFSSKGVAIMPSRATCYATLMEAGLAHCILPASAIRHRALERKHTAVVVGYDEVEWLGRIRIERPAAIKCHGVNRPSATTGASTSCQ